MSQLAPEVADTLENAVKDLLAAFDVNTSPIPVELMLQRPKAGMWKEVNLSELSTSFINVRQRYSPRMSVGRLLARFICRSDWGDRHQLKGFAENDEMIRALARAILIPKNMLDLIPPASRSTMAVSMRFEVPEDDARQRLLDLGYMTTGPLSLDTPLPPPPEKT